MCDNNNATEIFYAREIQTMLAHCNSLVSSGFVSGMCIKTSKIICPFLPQSKRIAQISQILNHNMKHYHVCQPLCTVLVCD